MIDLNDQYMNIELWKWLVILSIIMIIAYIYFMHCQCDDTSLVSKGGKVKVYNFNTSWCEWSKKFQPEWNNFEDLTKTDEKLNFVAAYDIKCDEENNTELCKKYSVPGFPYVVIEQNDKTHQYTGSRNANDIANYIIENYN